MNAALCSGLDEVVFLFALGGLIFCLYYRNYVFGTETILPVAWRNSLVH